MNIISTLPNLLPVFRLIPPGACLLIKIDACNLASVEYPLFAAPQIDSITSDSA